MSNKDKLCGVFPPTMTPFVDEQVAYDKLADNIGTYNETDLPGYMPLGSNGEFRALTDEESLRIIGVYDSEAAAEKTLIVGAGRESAKATLEFIDQIADKRVDYATLLPPQYFAAEMTDKVLIHYYTYVADRSPIPIMVYSATIFAAGLLVPPAVIAALADHPNIAGMKDTSPEDISEYIKAVPTDADFCVLAGTAEKFCEALGCGATGGVIAGANYLPQEYCRLYELYMAGDLHEAQEIDARMLRIAAVVSTKYSVAGVKAAMDLMGYFGGDPRIPLPPADDQAKAELRRLFEAEALL